MSYRLSRARLATACGEGLPSLATDVLRGKHESQFTRSDSLIDALVRCTFKCLRVSVSYFLYSPRTTCLA